MGRKIARVAGIVICVLLFISCALMIALSAAFGSEGLVGAFGYNLFICRESGFEGLDSGAAVVVEHCEPYDIIEGNLVVYKAAQGEDPVLGYAEEITRSDGVYTVVVSDTEGKTTSVSQGDLIGRAGWSSVPLGNIIGFVLTPWGVCVMAVLPCVALIVFSLVRAAIGEREEPEVLPQRKNDETPEKSAPSLGVKADGNAAYSRSNGAGAAKSADSVLFTYGKPKSPAAIRPDAASSSEKKAAVHKPAAESEKPVGAVPPSVAAKRYIDNATAPQKKSTPAAKTPEIKPEEKPAKKVSPAAMRATAEIPQLPKKQTKSDAFFAQSDVPQIGRSRKSDPRNRAVIELEDALAKANERKEPVSKKSADGVSRKSADILAAKSRSELMSDDDDRRDRGRYDVDDILAGIDNRNRS